MFRWAKGYLLIIIFSFVKTIDTTYAKNVEGNFMAVAQLLVLCTGSALYSLSPLSLGWFSAVSSTVCQYVCSVLGGSQPFLPLSPAVYSVLYNSRMDLIWTCIRISSVLKTTGSRSVNLRRDLRQRISNEILRADGTEFLMKSYSEEHCWEPSKLFWGQSYPRTSILTALC